MSKYHLVFKHDRAGRLVDAQVFERWRFSGRLLRELLEAAAKTVEVNKDHVIIRHAYIERRVIPLDLFIREADESAACAAVIDYGNSIKDMAANNIFPGDMMLKNFGVTRHGRVIFYDYDELALLTSCNFLHVPTRFHMTRRFPTNPGLRLRKMMCFRKNSGIFWGFRMIYMRCSTKNMPIC